MIATTKIHTWTDGRVTKWGWSCTACKYLRSPTGVNVRVMVAHSRAHAISSAQGHIDEHINETSKEK